MAFRTAISSSIDVESTPARITTDMLLTVVVVVVVAAAVQLKQRPDWLRWIICKNLHLLPPPQYRSSVCACSLSSEMVLTVSAGKASLKRWD
jgi:hypothetical protein